MRLAILTPALDYYVNWHADAGDYRRLFGEALSFREWSDPGNLQEFDLIMPLLVWGYQHNPDVWEEKLDCWRGLPFANSLETLRWNTKKTYLLELEARGIAIVNSGFFLSLRTGSRSRARHLWRYSLGGEANDFRGRRGYLSFAARRGCSDRRRTARNVDPAAHSSDFRRR